MNAVRFARLTCLSGLRSRAFWLVLVLAALLMGASWLAASFSGRQPLVVAMDVGYTSLRLSLLFLTLVWVQELLQKELDRRTVHWALAYPVSRANFLAGKMLGIAALLFLATLTLALPLWAFGHWANWGYAASSRPELGLVFAASLFAAWLESLVVLAVTVCLVTLSTTPFLAIALGLLFSLAGRGLGAVLDFLLFSPYADDEFKASFLPIAKVLRWLLPDLSALDWRQTVLYGHWQGMHPTAALMMGTGYTLVFAILAMLIFRKRALT
jgi:ABC-type transport system involved in multi-copper enzyme maturation permease subunit